MPEKVLEIVLVSIWIPIIISFFIPSDLEKSLWQLVASVFVFLWQWEKYK
jgi:hypothetical protein